MNKVKIKEDIIYNNRAKKDIIIAHTADIHFNENTSKKDLDKLYVTIKNIKPDYLMITGDIVDIAEITRNYDKIKELVTVLANIGKLTKVLISIGNHDVLCNSDYSFFRKLDDLYNIYVLDNKCYEDEYIYVAGFTLPMEYYYNIYKQENEEVLINYLDLRIDLTKNLPINKPKVALIHSPIRLTNDEVIKRLNNYDLILCGHTHNGMVPDFLDSLFKDNMGLFAPNKKLFPEIAKGKIIKNIGKKEINIIINGGYTKISKKSGKMLSYFNFIYNKSVNKILIKKKRGIKYEN